MLCCEHIAKYYYEYMSSTLVVSLRLYLRLYLRLQEHDLLVSSIILVSLLSDVIPSERLAGHILVA